MDDDSLAPLPMPELLANALQGMNDEDPELALAALVMLKHYFAHRQVPDCIAAAEARRVLAYEGGAVPRLVGAILH
jgi:hypothetical protein